MYRQPDLVDFGDRHGDWEVVGESVLIDRLDPSAQWDWLRIDTWIDRGRQFEDLQSRWVDPDRGVTGRHVLVDQELVQHLGLVVEGSYAIQANPRLAWREIVLMTVLFVWALYMLFVEGL